MRDDSYLESNSEQTQEVRPSIWKGRALTAFGATLSVVILAILVIWSYRLGVRDAADVPVIRAQTDAFKMRPEDPGGLEVAHQNRAIYTLVTPTSPTGNAGYAPKTEELADEDVAPSAAVDPDAAVVVASPEPLPSEQPQATEPVAGQQASGQSGGEQEIAAVNPLVESPLVVSAPDGNSVVETDAPVFEAGSPAPAKAPAPKQRPGKEVAATNSQAEAAEPRAAAAASPIQIQLGAFGSEKIAGEQWTALKARNGDLLNGRARVITAVSSGGRELFRLRAGPFENVADASALCRGLQARGEVCIVARAR
ncbi:MAG: SPOR domain-containing protein [Pikeienuella sp.]